MIQKYIHLLVQGCVPWTSQHHQRAVSVTATQIKKIQSFLRPRTSSGSILKHLWQTALFSRVPFFSDSTELPGYT